MHIWKKWMQVKSATRFLLTGINQIEMMTRKLTDRICVLSNNSIQFKSILLFYDLSCSASCQMVVLLIRLILGNLFQHLFSEQPLPSRGMLLRLKFHQQHQSQRTSYHCLTLPIFLPKQWLQIFPARDLTCFLCIRRGRYLGHLVQHSQ